MHRALLQIFTVVCRSFNSVVVALVTSRSNGDVLHTVHGHCRRLCRVVVPWPTVRSVDHGKALLSLLCSTCNGTQGAGFAVLLGRWDALLMLRGVFVHMSAL